MNNELFLLQLVDSASPTGAFSHSFGMETAFKENRLKSTLELYEWVQSFLSGSVAPTEGIAVYLAYQEIGKWMKNEELSDQVTKSLQLLDQKLYFGKMPRESREGSKKIGKRYLKIVNTLYPESGLANYQKWIDDNECYGNSAVVHGWVSAYLDIPPDVAIFTHLYASVNNQLQSALRLTAVGQTDVQLILQKLYPLMQEETKQIMASSPSLEDLYTFSIMQEIDGMRHETLYSRLFMS